MVLVSQAGAAAGGRAEIGAHAKAVASVLGGVTIGALADAYHGVPTFRLMPNTPVEVSHGVVLYSPTAGRRPRTRGATCWRCSSVSARVVTVPERLIERGDGGDERRSRVSGAGRRGPGRRRGPPRPGAGARVTAGGRDDGRHGGAAADARLRHARRPARGDLARRLDRPRAGGTRARRRARRVRRTRSTRSAGSRADDRRWRSIRGDIATYVERAVHGLHRADLHLHPAQPDVLVRGADPVLALERRG